MKNKTCKRHRAQPEFIYTDCVDCEIESYNSDLAELKGDLAELKGQYRWRDVKVELPVDDEEYLIWPHHKYAGVSACFWPYDTFGDLSKNTFNDNDDQLLHVTHWMPLPKFEVKELNLTAEG